MFTIKITLTSWSALRINIADIILFRPTRDTIIGEDALSEGFDLTLSQQTCTDDRSTNQNSLYLITITVSVIDMGNAFNEVHFITCLSIL